MRMDLDSPVPQSAHDRNVLAHARSGAITDRVL